MTGHPKTSAQTQHVGGPQAPVGSEENPRKWPYLAATAGEWVEVTTGLAQVEAIHDRSLRVRPRVGNRMTLPRRNHG